MNEWIVNIPCFTILNDQKGYIFSKLPGSTPATWFHLWRHLSLLGSTPHSWSSSPSLGTKTPGNAGETTPLDQQSRLERDHSQRCHSATLVLEWHEAISSRAQGRSWEIWHIMKCLQSADKLLWYLANLCRNQHIFNTASAKWDGSVLYQPSRFPQPTLP